MLKSLLMTAAFWIALLTPAIASFNKPYFEDMHELKQQTVPDLTDVRIQGDVIDTTKTTGNNTTFESLLNKLPQMIQDAKILDKADDTPLPGKTRRASLSLQKRASLQNMIKTRRSSIPAQTGHSEEKIQAAQNSTVYKIME